MTNVLILGANGQLARNTTRVFLRNTAEGRNAALKPRGDDVKTARGR
jgi:hypothetical protein